MVKQLKKLNIKQEEISRSQDSIQSEIKLKSIKIPEELKSELISTVAEINKLNTTISLLLKGFAQGKEIDLKEYSIAEDFSVLVPKDLVELLNENKK